MPQASASMIYISGWGPAVASPFPRVSQCTTRRLLPRSFSQAFSTSHLYLFDLLWFAAFGAPSPSYFIVYIATYLFSKSPLLPGTFSALSLCLSPLAVDAAVLAKLREVIAKTAAEFQYYPKYAFSRVAFTMLFTKDEGPASILPASESQGAVLLELCAASYASATAEIPVGDGAPARSLVALASGILHLESVLSLTARSEPNEYVRPARIVQLKVLASDAVEHAASCPAFEPFPEPLDVKERKWLTSKLAVKGASSWLVIEFRKALVAYASSVVKANSPKLAPSGGGGSSSSSSSRVVKDGEGAGSKGPSSSGKGAAAADEGEVWITMEATLCYLSPWQFADGL